MARRDSDMTEGNIWMHLIRFSVPMAIGLLFQQLYNTVDTLVVGQFVGKQAQAAVGSTGPIINTVVGFCAGLATGASVVISQRYGAHDDDGLSKAVHTTVALTFIMSLIATAVGQLIIPPMLRFMQTPEDVMADSSSYLSIYFAGISGILFYNLGSGILRAVGDSRRPLYFLILSALLNTVLDLLFVLVFGMKVDGVALATVLAQILSAALILVASAAHGQKIPVPDSATGAAQQHPVRHYLVLQRVCAVLHQFLRLRLHGGLRRVRQDRCLRPDTGAEHQHVLHHLRRAELGRETD